MSCPCYDATALGALARYLTPPGDLIVGRLDTVSAYAAALAEVSRHNARAAAETSGEPCRGATAREILTAALTMDGDRPALRPLAAATAHGLAYTLPLDAPRSAWRALAKMATRLLLE